MLRVVTWLWKPKPGYRAQFNQHHVNTLYRMVARNYHRPHEFVVVTDAESGFLPGIRIVPLWSTYSHLRSPHGDLQPSCYRRLRAFSPEMAEIIGPRFVSLDLDVVVTGDLTPLFERTEDFVIWAWPFRGTLYNGTMWMMDAGARAKVWTEFDPATSPTKSRLAGFAGSDQAWMNYVLGPDEATWGEKDGVVAFRSFRHLNKLPEGARLVSFHGLHNPWDERVRSAHPWVLDHYR